jgi:hypothetical protein
VTTFSPDKFGFYQVGLHQTFSKLEAFELAERLKSTASWNFNDAVFQSINWKVEPDKDLWSMYKERARQIRDAYDYVVLWYSGGSDSHNMLLAWIAAGCKIDEIATTWNYEATGEYLNHYNAEITKVVLPDIKKLKESGFEFKFRIIDISQHCLQIFDNWSTNFEYNINFHMSVNNPARNMFRETIPEYKNMIAAGKKVAFVWGKEKPQLRLSEDNKLYFSFCDNIDNCVGPHVQRKYHQGWYDELFYWSPDYPLIPVKQAHVIKTFCDMSLDKTMFEPLSVKKPYTYQANGISRKLNMHLTDFAIKTILYPKWSNGIFCNGKAGSFIYSLRDEWFLKSNLELSSRYTQIVNSYRNKLGFEDNTRSIHPHYSPRYFLE